MPITKFTVVFALVLSLIGFLIYKRELKKDPNFHKKAIQLGFFFLAGIIAATSYYNFFGTDPYGMDYNEERIKKNIPIIPEGWIENTSGKKTKLWYPKTNTKITKGRIGKEVILDRDGNLKMDRDAIRNVINGQTEYLKLEYHYQEAIFKYTHEQVQGGEIIKQTEIDRVAFDRKLEEWGVEKFYR